MSCLFTRDIHDWASWGKVYQSIEAFEPLIEHIFRRERLPLDGIGPLKPGTNAVFSAGGYVVKLFAPKESGTDTESDYRTELYGLRRADGLSLPVPKLLAYGSVEDKYVFPYLIMERFDGAELGKLEGTLTDGEKREIGRLLRYVTDRMTTPCPRFNGIDVLARALSNRRWDMYPDGFRRERLLYLRELTIPEDKKVFVHGDLNPDNILIRKEDAGIRLCVIDFADALSAPVDYEYATAAGALFCFEKPYMEGFFGAYETEQIADMCMKGLLLHDYGAGIARADIGPDEEITGLGVMRERLCRMIEKERNGGACDCEKSEGDTV